MFMLDTNTLIYFFKGMGAVEKHLSTILDEVNIIEFGEKEAKSSALISE